MSLSVRLRGMSKRPLLFGLVIFGFGLMIVLLSTNSAAATTPNQQAYFFRRTLLQGEELLQPTSLQFGPDGRLYVTQETGMIYAYTINRQSSGNYVVTATETIPLVRNIPNYNDDGSPSAVIGRQVLGIYVTGTTTNPELYVTSSDPRAEVQATGEDLGLDTNSGVVSHLIWDDTNEDWKKTDLVRGLPRSEYKHATNGLILDESTNTLFVAQGGHTNAGSPGKLLAYLTEYALSAAILAVDLDAIKALPTQTDARGQQYKYDLPTLEDPSGTSPPWGGNDGFNQALLVPGGPVQVYSPGYRNPYDVLLTADGRLYTVDNGANPNWGGYPENEGPPTGTPPVANCTNRYIQGQPGFVNNQNGLHYIPSAGYYGGHPNPVRGNPGGAGLHTGEQDGPFIPNPTANWPPVQLAMANPVECDFLQPNAGPGTIDPDGSLITYDASTNGIAEYTASNFDGELQGDLLMAGYTGEIYRAKLNTAGNEVTNGVEVLAAGVGEIPLDLTTQGDEQPFPGTIWIALYGAGDIMILEPAEPSLGFLSVVVRD